MPGCRKTGRAVVWNARRVITRLIALVRRLRSATLKVCLGLLLGLVIAEGVFRLRDDGAFPHVNLYLPDAELGTRLEPFATQRLAFTGNPATSLRINSRGFRGPEWPAPVPDELIVVGDSQVFGLGVEEADTFPSQLAKASGRQVINAGVPTYGPFEYLAVARRLQRERPGAKIVFVFNVANDFFELDRPNVKRHAVWDGWAVRRENAPGRVRDFPGRRWLFSQSHLVFALRKLQLERQQVRGDSEALAEFDGRDRGTTSEGWWTDLLTEAERQQRAPAPTMHGQGPADLAQRLAPLEAQIRESTKALDSLARQDDGPRGIRSERLMNEVLTRQVGDVVRDTGSEMARSIPVTAELLATAAEEKARLTELRRRLELARVPHDETLKRSYAELEQLRWELPAPVVEAKVVPGVAVLDALASLPDSTLVVLPLDVQVSSTEWAKYGATPTKMEPTLELNQALVAAAYERGLRAVELTDTLRAAEPGAFLLGDLHLTRKGTRAAAATVAEALKVMPNRPAVPEQPSLPSPQAWSAAPTLTVKGGAEAGCETKRVRDWLRVRCESKNPGFWFSSLRLLEGLRGEAQLAVARNRASAVLPLRAEGRWRVGFVVSGYDQQAERVLTVAWREGEPVIEFSRAASDSPVTPAPVAEALLDCEARLGGPASIPWGNLEADSPCLEYPDCVRRLACAQGHPFVKPRCPKGSTTAGPDFRCLRRCTDDAACVDAFGPGSRGRCLPAGAERVCF